MRYVKYIGEDEDELVNEQIYPVLDEESDIWVIECNNGGVGVLLKHEAVEVKGFTKIVPTELMLEANLIKHTNRKH